MQFRTGIFPTALMTLALLAAPGMVAAQRGTAVIASGQEATLPIPYIGTASLGNADVADQLFLRLGTLIATFRTAGDNILLPQLASRWRRESPTSIVFTLDSRARWHDGVAVTARDVEFTWSIINNPTLNPNHAVFANVDTIEAIGSREVRVRFHRPHSEQMYTAGFEIQPLPAHLLAHLPTDSIASSGFARRPIGNGPFKWERRVPGQFVELVANTGFYLDRPLLSRLVIRFLPDPQARFNLLLSGGLDALSEIPWQLLDRVTELDNYRVVEMPSTMAVYALFNTRDPVDTGQAHPAFDDPRVREALSLALSRDAIARSAFGPNTSVPDAPISQLWEWARPPSQRELGSNPARARQLLNEAGWVDSDNDGIRDRDGQPLRLRLIYPASSGARHAIAIPAEAMWRSIGVDVVLDRSDFPVYLQRRKSGDWDLDLTAVIQDPSPSSLTQSWSCGSARTAGSSNVARWCDPTFDTLLQIAVTTQGNSRAPWTAALDRIAEQRPAIFLAAPRNSIAVHRRFLGVQLLPQHQWLPIWRWRVDPDQALPRDT